MTESGCVIEHITMEEMTAALSEFLDRLCISADMSRLHNVMVSKRGVRLTFVDDSGPVSVIHVEQHHTETVDNLTARD